MFDPSQYVRDHRIPTLGKHGGFFSLKIECVDGFTVSIQASASHYCEPRSNTGPWASFELGFPTAADPIIAEYAEDRERPTDTVYGYVPAATVAALIESHGGPKDLITRLWEAQEKIAGLEDKARRLDALAAALREIR